MRNVQTFTHGVLVESQRRCRPESTTSLGNLRLGFYADIGRPQRVLEMLYCGLADGLSAPSAYKTIAMVKIVLDAITEHLIMVYI